MEHSSQPIHLVRIDRARNMARFYMLSVEETLFGTALCRNWGRIGTRGRSRTDHFPDTGAALAAWQGLTHSKMRRGYVPADAGAFDLPAGV